MRDGAIRESLGGERGHRALGGREGRGVREPRFGAAKVLQKEPRVFACELSPRSAEMRRNRRLRDEKLLGDALVRKAPIHAVEHLVFARAQAGSRLIFVRGFEKDGRHERQPQQPPCRARTAWREAGFDGTSREGRFGAQVERPIGRPNGRPSGHPPDRAGLSGARSPEKDVDELPSELLAARNSRHREPITDDPAQHLRWEHE